MKLLKTILLAADSDNGLDGVLAAAGALAKKFGSGVILAQAVETANGSGQTQESLGNAIAARFESMQQQWTACGVSVPQSLCLHGPVEIVEAAERLGASLIMLPARGVASEHFFPVETTSEKVLRGSAKPVLVVPPEPPLAFANIICAIDFSAVSARALSTAVHLARAFRGKLQIVTVIGPPSGNHRLDPPWAERAASAEPAASTAQRQHQLDEFLTRLDFQGVTWETHVLHGDPAHEIVQRAISTHADLIVMGSASRTGLPYVFMGSTTVKVARQLPCALLTTKRVEVLVPDIAKKIDDISAAIEEGQTLLAQGFCQEAIGRFDQCLGMDSRRVDAIEAKADAFDRLGRREQANNCRKLAETIQRELGEQRVTALVRAEHPLFHRPGPYEQVR